MSKKLQDVSSETSTNAPLEYDDDLISLQSMQSMLDEEDEEAGIKNETESKSDDNVDTSVLATSDEDLKQREMTIGTKSSQKGNYVLEENGKRLDQTGSKEEQQERLGGTVSKDPDNNNLLQYDGSLGTFSYDPNVWAVGVKQITQGEFSAEIPVLRYIGDKKSGNDIDIPEGVKNLDYAFEGNETLETVPYIPEGVESAHCAFMGCTNVTRGSGDAKKGEQSGWAYGLGLAGGGAATGAGVGAVATSWSGPGALIGAGIGTVVGGTAGIISGVFMDGKGGTWSMTDSIKDSSSMFAGCENLTEAYEAAGDDLINARNMYEGTKDLGTDWAANFTGSTSVTDFTDSKLSKEAVQDSYTDTNVELTPNLSGNYSKNWDETSEKLMDNDATIEEKQEVEDLNRTLKKEDVLSGHVETDMSVATDGLASSAKQKTETGYTTTENIYDENADTGILGGVGGVNGLLDRGLVTVGEFAILRLVTGNSIIAGVGAIGLQYLGILPKSMEPILNGVVSLVGEDSSVGKAISNFSDTLGFGDGEQKAGADGMVSDAGDRIRTNMEDGLLLAAEGEDLDLTACMRNNAQKVTNDGVFLEVGKLSSSDKAFDTIGQPGALSAAALEEYAQKLAGDSGSLTDENKQKLQDAYRNVMNGLETYSQTASEQIDLKYGANSADGATAHTGLENTMKKVSDPILFSMKELDATYGFMDESFQNEMDGLTIAGVNGYSSYASGLTVQQQQPQDDDALYMDAGLDDPVESDTPDVSFEESQTDSTTDSKKPMASAERNQNKSQERIAELDAVMQDSNADKEDAYSLEGW